MGVCCICLFVINCGSNFEHFIMYASSLLSLGYKKCAQPQKEAAPEKKLKLHFGRGKMISSCDSVTFE